MPTFIYEAQNNDGVVIRGLVEAKTRSLALSELKTYRLHVRTIQEQTRLTAFFNKLLGIKLKLLAIFTRELATMFKAGLPLVKCLEVLTRKGENRRLEDVLLLVQEHIKAGSSFYEGIAKYPDVFDPVYLALVRSGEISGQLEEILDRLAVFLEKESKLRQTAKAAMTYPLVVFTFCTLISTGLIVFIFPQFISLFEGLEIAMPWPTRILVFIVSMLKNPFVLLLLFGLAGFSIASFNRYVKTRRGRKQFHQWLLTMPLLGKINQKIAIARFCRTFSTLFASGVPILHALEVVSKVSGNELINEAIEHVREAVKYGSSISAPLEESALFPPMVTSMIHIGEQSGHLQTMLGKIADYYEMEVEIALNSLSKLMEPALIGIMGFIVGFVLIAIFLPIYQLIGNFTK